MVVDEYRTSKVCSTCYNEMTQYAHPTSRCPHRVKRIRPLHQRGNKGNLFCLDDQGNPIHRTDQCPDRIYYPLSSYRSIVYALKVCQHCARVPEQGRFWNRDINAGRNMMNILRRYINFNCSLDSRPPELCPQTRANQPPETGLGD